MAALAAFGLMWGLTLLAASDNSQGAERFAALRPGQQATALMSLSSLIALVATYVVIVKWHRMIIRDLPPAQTRRKAFGAAVLYFARSIFLGGLLLLIIMIFGLLPMTFVRDVPLPVEVKAYLPVVWLAVVIAGALLTAIARSSLILPAAAVGDHEMNLRRSWALTRGNSWRIFIGSVLSAGPALIVNLGFNAFIKYLRSSGGDVTTLTAAMAVSLVLVVLTACIQASFLSYAYLFFVEPRAQTSGA